MALEDFFTLTEMKDGLTASSRVRELINALLEDKDCVLKNAAKQWSTVASTIAATDDKECLELFVQLDGISFISRWLKDAQNFGDDQSDSFAEELISVLLCALEKLHLNYEQSMSYGIWLTVENLLSHNSSRVLERARVLYDSWKQQGDNGTIAHGSRNLGGERGQKKPCAGSEEEQSKPGEEMVADVRTNSVDKGKVSDHHFMEDESPLMLKRIEASLPHEGEQPPCHLEGNASSSAYTSVAPRRDGLVLDEFSSSMTDTEKQMPEDASPSNKLGAMEISCPIAVKNASKCVMGNGLQMEVDMKVHNQSGDSPVCDMKTEMSSSKNENTVDIDGILAHHCESIALSQNQDQDCGINALECSENEGGRQKLEDPVTPSSADGSDSSDDEHSSDRNRGLANDYDFLKTKTSMVENDVVSKSRSDFELNYGIIDALEVARQVAIEVEREVEGRREASCSSSQEQPEAETKQVDSPESLRGEVIQTAEGLPKGGSPKRGEGEVSNDQKDPIDVAENSVQQVDSSQVPNGVQELENNGSEKGIIDLDLNQEILSEDMDHMLDPISTPLSIASTSRAAVAPDFPLSPLQFEGARGWKGSAATNAHRSASPRIDDNRSKHHQNFLDFDLNMAEDGDGRTAEPIPGKQNICCGESSGEARVNLDLNRISDDGDAVPSDWRTDERQLVSRNGCNNASPTSSSSSMHPSLRNFDLNDQPSLFNESQKPHPFFGKPSQKPHSSVGPRSGENVIYIMGTRLEVNRKDLYPQAPSLPNGRILEPTRDFNVPRSGGVLGTGPAVSYPHPSIYPYNGLITGSTGTFSSALYGPSGPTPYMIDSRGAPVVPQLVGSAPAAPASYSQPSFAGGIYGMPPPGLNGLGPPRRNFDLNSSLVVERVDRDSSGGLRQFLSPVQGRSLDELRSNFQPSSSVSVGKRKEPEGGWEPYPFHPRWK